MLGLVLRKLPPPLRALALTALGGYLIWGGIRAWIEPASCDGHDMAAGQLCWNSDHTTSTVAEVLHTQHTHAWFPFITGLVFLAVAVLTLMRPQRLR